MDTNKKDSLALFRAFPELARKLDWLPLANLPTPVQQMNLLAEELDEDDLFIKRDDLSGEVYGGNKVRKLEFLLGEARARGADSVMTFGTAGSNHCLATAIYARSLGMEAISILSPQTNSASVGRNLLMGFHVGAELHHYHSEPAAQRGAAWQSARRLGAGKKAPHIIRRGGSSSLGTVGFVNAGLELAEQIKRGELPEPDLLYVAMGTMGTAVGLALGLAVANLRTKVVAVRVVDLRYGNEDAFHKLFDSTATLLNKLDENFPKLRWVDANVEFRHEQFGQKYALFTEAGMEAVSLLRSTEGIQLEGTYTGKAMAALIADSHAGNLEGRRVLFWNTYNSRPFPAEAMNRDYQKLPFPVQDYFEKPCQALDP
ncbi:MAG: pyridoxal-phosphate dependent enzyme [Chromatiales bacterium]|nr:pyridoxal-phosphate dependent enzyme [Chromatiales bacterium]